jgi:hypothetical protein
VASAIPWLAVAVLLVIGGAAVTALVISVGRRRQALERRQRPARLRRELEDISNYIRRVDQAAADADLDRLEQDRENDKWDCLSSR